MSQYVKSPFRPPTPLLVANSPQYVLGSWNSNTGPTTGTITFSKTNGTTTATVKLQILSGNIPKNGSLITVVGSSVSANMNVTNVAISNVTMIPDANGNDTGLYSMTYAITSTATPTTYTADAAQAIIPQPEIGEDITGMGTTYASISVAAPFNNPQMDQGKALSVTVSFPALYSGSSATVSLQGADFDVDSEFQDIAVVATVTAGSIGSTGHFNSGQGASGTPAAVNLSNWRFYRLNITNVANLGTTGQTTIVGKIEC